MNRRRRQAPPAGRAVDHAYRGRWAAGPGRYSPQRLQRAARRHRQNLRCDLSAVDDGHAATAPLCPVPPQYVVAGKRQESLSVRNRQTPPVVPVPTRTARRRVCRSVSRAGQARHRTAVSAAAPAVRSAGPARAAGEPRPRTQTGMRRPEPGAHPAAVIGTLISPRS